MEELTVNPLLKIQGYDAKRSGPLEIMAEIGGIERNVVIDTGAEVNVIAKDFVNQNAWKHLVKEHKEEILGISNQPITTDGKLVLEVSIKGRTVPVEFIIVPVTNIIAILGIEFAREHQVKLEFRPKKSQMKWKPNGKGKPRMVPLIINTHAPQLTVRRKVKLINKATKQNVQMQPRHYLNQTTKEKEKEVTECCKQEYPRARRASYGLPTKSLPLASYLALP